jgi:hypothetical protein
MTEVVAPVVDDTKPVIPEVVQEVETPEYSELESEMMTHGWKPKDQFEGEEEEFVSASEFKRRGELFKKIADTNRRLDKATQTIQQLTTHQKQVYQAGYQAALKQLRADHEIAVEAGDRQTAAAIVQKIEETTTAAAQAASTPAAPPEPPAVLGEFMDRHKSWYQKDDVMTAYADRVGHLYAAERMRAGQKPDFAEILTHVESKVREKFPSSFGTVKRTAPSVVEGSSTPNRPAASTRGQFGESDLNEMERMAMTSFVRDGVMTKAEYISDIKKIRGIK